MRRIISLDEVNAVRERIARAHAIAAERFRDAFAASGGPPEETWRLHLAIQAAALIEIADGVRVRGGGNVEYDIRERIVTPFVVRGEPLFPHLIIARTPEAIFEYFLIIMEILAWHATKVIATPVEYDDAIRRMTNPQVVRVAFGTLLPAVEIRDDETAMLEVTLYTHEGEERIERRTLALDAENEFHFHSREVGVTSGRST